MLRAEGSKPPARRGKVLFINADRDYREGRAQNYLEPEHIEKIVSAYRAFEDVAGFARVVLATSWPRTTTTSTSAATSTPRRTPSRRTFGHTCTAASPGSEVAAKADLFTAHGLAPDRFLCPRTPTTSSLPTWSQSGVTSASDRVRPRRRRRRGRSHRRYWAWWETQEARFDKLQSTRRPRRSAQGPYRDVPSRAGRDAAARSVRDPRHHCLVVGREPARPQGTRHAWLPGAH